MDMQQIFKNISENHHGFKDLIFEYQDYYAATDTYFLLAVPKKYVTGDFTISDRAPDMSFILNSTRHDPIKLDMGLLIQKFQEIPKIESYPDCENCDGYGATICDCCESEVKCSVCKGSGLDKEKPTEMENDYHYVFTFGDAFLTIHVIDLLIRTIESLNYKGDVNVVSSGNQKPMIIEIDDKFIAMAPAVSYSSLGKVIKIY